MTDADFIAWLGSDTSRRTVLIEAAVRSGGSEITRYMSSGGYVTSGSDTPAHTVYEATVIGGCKTSESLSLDPSSPGTLTYADIEIDNTSGDFDIWLDDVWDNRVCNVYVGDMSWVRSDFRLVFSGVISGLDSRSRNILNLKLIDQMHRLKHPVSDAVLGGSTANKDQLKPLIAGEVFNMEPLLVDPATLTYQVNIGNTENIIEVRDFGVPLALTTGYTVSLSTGRFTLLHAPAGTITASVQGIKDATAGYVNTVASIIQVLVKNYGTQAFSSGELDAANFSAFETANPQYVGITIKSGEEIEAVCQELASSVGAQLCCSTAGQLRLLKVDLPVSGGTTQVTPSEMISDSFTLSQRPSVVAAVTLNFCRNWMVQPDLQTGIPAEHKALFAQEWLKYTSTDSTTATNYKLSATVTPVDTLLLQRTQASAEADRRLALWKVQRKVFQYTGKAELMLEELGGGQTIYHPRFNLGAGVTAQIISIDRDWIDGSAVFQVLM